MLALLEGLLPLIWIAAVVGLSIVAGRVRSRLPVALGLTAVPAIGFLFLEVFC